MRISDNSLIRIFRGDTHPGFIFVKEKGQPKDLTGHNFVMSVSKIQNPNQEDILFQIAGAVMTPVTDGIVKFQPSSNDVNRTGKFWYDIQMQDNQGNLRTIVKQRMIFTQDITK